MKALNRLKLNEEARIVGLSGENQRLRDLGLVEGTRVKCVLKSPLGDPAAYRVKGAVIAVREQDAASIDVESLHEEAGSAKERVAKIVLAGNPNVGKSTIFNSLTGMRQHTGNWAGKTVAGAEGIWKGKQNVHLIDAPGCYSLKASSLEEEVARDQICDNSNDGVIVVCDGTCLERNLILVLQILSQRRDVVVCINMMDQVRNRGLSLDTEKLQQLLGVPVITAEASEKSEMKVKMKKAAELLCRNSRKGEISEGFNENLLASPEETAAEALEIFAAVVDERGAEEDKSLRVDRALTNPVIGFPIMAVMVLFLFWITVEGANYPSALLSEGLFSLEVPMYEFLINAGLPAAVCEVTAFGIYRVLAWVVSVMLPPMAIFFPLFTLLEDWGFLPRVAFNLDRCFKCCKACGKQALTMCMGLGCNASAVVGCRIIDSRRERLLAMVTNSFVPCNGRFPMLIAVITMFFASESGWKGSAILTAVIFLGIGMTFAATKMLSATVLKGMPSSFTLELPPYRKPEFGKVIVRSVMDRTLFVLGRAVVVAAPAGAIIWILANTAIGETSLIEAMSHGLDPLGELMGLDGVILTAFILGLPANEIVLPIAMMIYMNQGMVTEVNDLMFFKELLIENGWTALTAVNMMVFALMHWPCATTLLSVRKESGSWKWAALSFAVPLAMGIIICVLTASIYRFVL